MKSSLIDIRVHALMSILRHPGLVKDAIQQYLFKEEYYAEVPLQSVFSLFDEKHSDVKLQCLESDAEGVTITELGIINWITRNVIPKTIFEFGTSNGRTTLNFALNSNQDCRIWTLDLPVNHRLEYYEQEKFIFGDKNFNVQFKDIVGSCFQDHPLSDKITQLYGDSTHFDFKMYFGKMDLIFVDANHDYEYVKSDTENALKMLSDVGTIIWHDYPSWPGVWKYLDELLASGLPLFHINGTKLVCYSRLLDKNRARP